MSTLTVSLVQTDLVWHSPQANRSALAAQIMPLAGQTDVVILPEMFTTGFSKHTQLAEAMDGPTAAWMHEMATTTNAAITGSFMCADADGQFKNRLVWASPDGQVQHYDKRHLFTFAHEHEVYAPGNTRLIVECRGWRICPLVCYDLRFPVWSRNAALTHGLGAEIDLLVYVANWPEVRSQAWKDLLVARAHENLCYVAGVNRIGTDGLGHAYSGDSRLFGPRGELLASAFANQAQVFSVHLDGADLKAYRAKFPALLDADSFQLTP